MIPPPPDRYCAAVCRNGHIIKDDLNPPNLRGQTRVTVSRVGGAVGPKAAPFCGRCGSAVLQACLACDAPLLGAFAYGRDGRSEYEALDQPESFCWECGEAYPWATREERVGKLYDLVDHEDLDEATLLTVREQIAVLSAPVDEETDERRGRAMERLKGLVPKTYEAVLPVLQGLATAEMKKRFDLQ